MFHFAGIEKFPGRVLHAHDFGDANEFAGKNSLLIGASYSMKILLSSVLKYGAKSIICTLEVLAHGFSNGPRSARRRSLCPTKI